jgi:hypothetical protein
MKEKVVVISFTLLSVFLFTYVVRFLPTVILSKTISYKGECEIFVLDSHRGGSLDVHFEEKGVSFSRK